MMIIRLISFHRTLLKDCPFVIKVRTTADGQKLYIKEMSGDHNHELSEVWFPTYLIANFNVNY